MAIAVRYFTRTGNTKKIAEAIAAAIGVEAKDIKEPLNYPLDILFIGGSMYANKADEQLIDFVKNLEKSTIGKVVFFGSSLTSASVSSEMRNILNSKDILADEREFYCRGKFLLFNSKKPDEKDLEDAASFAKSVVS